VTREACSAIATGLLKNEDSQSTKNRYFVPPVERLKNNSYKMQQLNIERLN